MFKFVHAWQPGDSWEPLAANGFVGIEVAQPADDAVGADPTCPDGVPVVCWTVVDATFPEANGGGRLVMAVEENLTTTFTLSVSQDLSPAVLGAALRNRADGLEGATALISNTGPFGSAAALWNVLEAAQHPRVKVALDINAAIAAGERAAVLVPTLNLRIGSVRVRQIDAELSDYARRLAGIGFDGYVVTDPPAGPDRAAASVAIATAFREVLPAVKPVKKVPAKVAK